MISSLLLMIPILCGVGVVIFISGFEKMQQWAVYDRSKRRKQLQNHDCTFSLSAYFDRIEKEHIRLLEECEKRKPILIELWWGLEGIQLQPDGTTKKIKRSRTQYIAKNYDNMTDEEQFRDNIEQGIKLMAYQNKAWGEKQRIRDINNQKLIELAHQNSLHQFHMEQSQKIMDSINSQMAIQRGRETPWENTRYTIQRGMDEQTAIISAWFMMQNQMVSDAYRSMINPYSPTFPLSHNPYINYLATPNPCDIPTSTLTDTKLTFYAPCEGMNNDRK